MNHQEHKRAEVRGLARTRERTKPALEIRDYTLGGFEKQGKGGVSIKKCAAF